MADQGACRRERVCGSGGMRGGAGGVWTGSSWPWFSLLTWGEPGSESHVEIGGQLRGLTMVLKWDGDLVRARGWLLTCPSQELGHRPRVSPQPPGSVRVTHQLSTPV